jgi:hypothetical protein
MTPTSLRQPNPPTRTAMPTPDHLRPTIDHPTTDSQTSNTLKENH